MKRSLCLAMFVFLALSVASFGRAEGIMDRMYVQGDLSAAIPTADGLDTTAYYGGRVGYTINDYVAVEVQSGYANFDDSEGLGDLTIVPLLANVRISPFPDMKFNPYIFGGLGVLFTDVNVDISAVGQNRLASAEASLGFAPGTGQALGYTESVSADIDNAFAGQIGIGAQYHFTENVSAFVEASAIIASEPDMTINDTVKGGTFSSEIEVVTSQELHTILIGCGLKVKF